MILCLTATSLAVVPPLLKLRLIGRNSFSFLFLALSLAESNICRRQIWYPILSKSLSCTTPPGGGYAKAWVRTGETS
jgi:hypothetical protein